MPWAKITSKATGVAHYDLTPAAFDSELWDIVPIVDDRCPVGLEEVDEAGNIVVPLAAAKAAAWDQVKAIRLAKETGTCSTPQGVVQIDDRSKVKIDGALSLCRLKEELGQPFAMQFTLADNSRVALDNVKVRQLAGAVGLYVQTLWDHAYALRLAIEAAADVAAIAAIDVEAGWP